MVLELNYAGTFRRTYRCNGSSTNLRLALTAANFQSLVLRQTRICDGSYSNFTISSNNRGQCAVVEL